MYYFKLIILYILKIIDFIVYRIIQGLLSALVKGGVGTVNNPALYQPSSSSNSQNTSNNELPTSISDNMSKDALTINQSDKIDGYAMLDDYLSTANNLDNSLSDSQALDDKLSEFSKLDNKD